MDTRDPLKIEKNRSTYSKVPFLVGQVPQERLDKCGHQKQQYLFPKAPRFTSLKAMSDGQGPAVRGRRQRAQLRESPHPRMGEQGAKKLVHQVCNICIVLQAYPLPPTQSKANNIFIFQA